MYEADLLHMLSNTEIFFWIFRHSGMYVGIYDIFNKLSCSQLE